MNSAARWIFLLALIVALAWAATEIALRRGRPAEFPEGALCKPALPTPDRLRNARILSIEGREMRAYDATTESLIRYEINGTGPRALQTLPLRCHTPGYHCFPVGNDGPERLTVLPADESHGLIRASRGDRSEDFPYEWTSRDLRLASPLRICGRALSGERAHLAWTSATFVALDEISSRVGFFRVPSYDGTLWKAVAREPDQAWSFDDTSAFRESACAEPSPRTRVELGTFNGLLWFLKDDPGGSQFTLFDLDLGTRKLDADDLRGPWKKIRSLAPSALLMEGAGDQPWLLAEWRPKGPRLLRRSAALFENFPRVSYRLNSGGALLRMSSSRWLTAPRLDRLGESAARPLASGAFALSATEPAEWNLVALGGRDFLWISQDGEDVEMRRLDCSADLTSPNK